MSSNRGEKMENIKASRQREKIPHKTKTDQQLIVSYKYSMRQRVQKSIALCLPIFLFFVRHGIFNK